MSMVEDDHDERRTEIERMIDEFLLARSRRLARAATVKGQPQVVESQREAYRPIPGSTTTPPSHD